MNASNLVGFIAAISALLILFLFDPAVMHKEKEPVKSTTDNTNVTMMIKTVLYDARTELAKALGDDVVLEPGGRSFWVEWVDQDTGEPIRPPNIMPTCEIHAVRPKNVESIEIEALGHELAHCIYGSYHK